MMHNFFFMAAPSRAPNVSQVRSSGPRSIFLQWNPIPQDYLHGILRGYHVFYKEEVSKAKRSAISLGIVKSVSVNMSMESLEITGLKPFTYYDVWVTAYTHAGSGPRSEPIKVITEEDGKYVSCKILFSCKDWFFFFFGPFPVNYHYYLKKPTRSETYLLLWQSLEIFKFTTTFLLRG